MVWHILKTMPEVLPFYQTLTYCVFNQYRHIHKPDVSTAYETLSVLIVFFSRNFNVLAKKLQFCDYDRRNYKLWNNNYLFYFIFCVCILSHNN